MDSSEEAGIRNRLTQLEASIADCDELLSQAASTMNAFRTKRNLLRKEAAKLRKGLEQD